MDPSTFDFDTLTLVLTIMGSTLTVVFLMYRQFNHLDEKFDRKFDDLNTRVGRVETTIAPIDTRFDGIDTRFDGIDTRLDGIDSRFDKLEARFDALGHDVSDARERLARIEGHLMGPESFRMRSPRPTAPDEPSSEDPDPDRRQSG